MLSVRTVQLPPLAFRALVGSVNEEKRTVELIFSTGAAVTRSDFWTGKRWVEKLSMKPEHVRLGRLNDGASVLDAHSAYSITNILGVVEPGTARIQGGKGLLTARFSERESLRETWQDIKSGIVRHVSVGYQIHKMEEDAGSDNKLPVRTAVDWEPYEVSMVPMPADPGSRTRSQDKPLIHRCTVIANITDADRMRSLRFAKARS